MQAKTNNPAVKINRLHKAFCAGLRKTCETAIQLGGLLVAQKELCGHGNWIPWIEKNLEFGERQVRRYMSCYDNRDKLPKRTSKTDFTLGIEEFLKLCEEPKVVVVELVEEPKAQKDFAQVVFVKGQERPVKIGGKPLATMRQIPKPSAPLDHLAAACASARIAGISGDELIEMLKALLPEYGL